MELEKKYGNLDNYYIDFSNKRAEKEVVKIINNIICTDNSVHIGNDNNIEKSSVKTINYWDNFKVENGKVFINCIDFK